MLINSLHKRWVMRFFVLIYLLLSFSTASASFWCHGEQRSSYLESGPVGRCWTACGSEGVRLKDHTELNKAELSRMMPGDDCLDLQVYSSALTSSTRSNVPHRIVVLDIDPADYPFVTLPGFEASPVIKQSIPSRLPPTQTSAALRTIVLLH